MSRAADLTDSEHPVRGFGEGLREPALALPTALAACLGAGLAWREQGSILAEHWLPYALALAVLVAVVLAAGVGVRPGPYGLAALAGTAALACWTALSAAWSPLPSLARDEALLIAFYALAFALPVVTLRSAPARTAAAATVVAAGVVLSLGIALLLAFGDDPADRFNNGRLFSPIGYVNAQAAGSVIAFWPAVALAAQRTLPVPLRVLALGAATAVLAAGLLPQSKGAAVALAVAALAVFSLSADRLRLLLPALVPAVLVAISYRVLTDPFRTRDADAAVSSIRDAGERVLVLTAVALLIGAVYAIVDRRLELSPRVHRGLAVAAAGAVLLAGLSGAATFAAEVEHPRSWLSTRWEEFKRIPEEETGSSHLVNLGSNRYDFWRVALNEFRDHPLAGIGARGWDIAYLEHGRSTETPRRAHSLELDTASETGLVGLVLLAAALLPALAFLAVRARRDLLGAGLFAAAVYWLVHASGDWIWTLPAVGLPFFLLLGIGASSDAPPPLRSRLALAGAALAAAVAVLAFAPPWLSARITAEQLERPTADPHADLRWARRLDPLSIDPLLAEAELAPTPAAALPPLRRAADREPRSAGLRYQLGVAYLDAGRPRLAVVELRAARRLSPRDPTIAAALERARAAARDGTL